MAIQKIIKAHIVCPSEIKEEILFRLQLWGAMEIISGDNGVPEHEESREYDIYRKIEFIRKYIHERYGSITLWQKLKKGLPVLNLTKAEEIEKKTDIDSDYSKLREIDTAVKEINTRIDEISAKIEIIGSVTDINITAKDLMSENFNILFGSLSEEYRRILENQEDIYIYSDKGNNPDIVLIVYSNRSGRTDEIEKIISDTDFRPVILHDSMKPSEVEASGKKEIEEINKKLIQYSDDAEKLFLPKKLNYDVLSDIYNNRIELFEKSALSDRTNYTSLIKGWIPEKMKKNLKLILKDYSERCYFQFSKPERGEDPPVLLDNGSFSRPFEIVTGLYGTPSYNWIDPTPYLAPYFALFFGICLTDAGYGVVIGLLLLWSLRKLKLPEGTRKFLKLLVWGCLFSVIAGMLTGGWFGNALSGVRLLNRIKVLDPLEKPQYFLYFSVGLGYIQVVSGVVISVIKNIRSGYIKEAFFAEFPWLLVLASLPLFFAGGLFPGLAKIILLTGCSGVVFLSGYNSKNIFTKFASGLYNLYGGTDYFKDMISYSRLFALGMGTGILALAVNELSLQAGGIPVLGYLLIVIVFVGGHIFNIVMSVLSAYIHTSRLQYVEFFSKFFKGGGRSFNPFSWKSRAVNITE